MSYLVLKEHSSSSYSPRTSENANAADLTAAFAIDFTTAGERCTHKAAGNKYLALWIKGEVIPNARNLYSYCKKLKVKELNIAGNGIYTLNEKGWSQSQVNQYVYETLKLVHQHYPIQKIRSGGQTGVDIAGLVAAVELGIDAVGLFPKGFIQRSINKIDVSKDKDTLYQEILNFTQELDK